MKTIINEIEIEMADLLDDLRKYLGDYYKNNNCSKVTVDNIRRIISSFFND